MTNEFNTKPHVTKSTLYKTIQNNKSVSTRNDATSKKIKMHAYHDW